MKVDFFIIGAPKCGTTSLATHLNQHADVCFSQPKEVHYFTSDMLGVPDACAAQSIDEYHAMFFKQYDARIHRVVGEGSANYLFYEQAVARILDYNPSAKLIVMLRNPVDMVISWHSQLLKSLAEDEADLEKAWALQSERAEGRCLPDVPRVYTDFLQYRDICMLGKQVERLLSKVPSSNVRFYLLEDFSKDPRSVYVDVCRFLGIRDDGRDIFERENVRSDWRSERMRKIYFALFSIKKALFWKPFPFQLDRKIRQCLFLSGGKTDTTVSNEFRSILRREFYSDIILLSELLGKDLSSWTES